VPEVFGFRYQKSALSQGVKLVSNDLVGQRVFRAAEEFFDLDREAMPIAQINRQNELPSRRVSAV
jgi:hypothetical protein